MPEDIKDVTAEQQTADNQSTDSNVAEKEPVQTDKSTLTTKTKEQVQTTKEEPNAVPEKYKYERPTTWDDNYTQNVERIAKENKLTNEQMKVFAHYAEKEHQAFLETRQQNMQKWEETLRKDPDFAGDNFNEAVQYASAGLKHIDTDGDLAKVLEESGYGSHPAVVRAMYKIGKMLDNDSIVGKGSSAKNTPLWDRLYNKK